MNLWLNLAKYKYGLTTAYSNIIYATTSELPQGWNTLAADNIFLSKEYFEILEQAAPQNMRCHYIGIFDGEDLLGIALSQFIDLNTLDTLGGRDHCFKSTIRNVILKNFSSHVLFIGNNMLTGQNAFAFSDKTNPHLGLQSLKKTAEELKKIFKSKGKKIHITTFKDFKAAEVTGFNIPEFKNNYKFSTQPNMVLSISEQWNCEDDYIQALTKKYRDQYKRARKKAVEIEKRKMSLQDIIEHEEKIMELYLHVAQNAPFNTFLLPKNHFRIFKEKLKEKFLFYGYFIDGQLVGFNTLVKNGKSLDTYFLGYEESIQREKMLYLNMLYDMVAYSINKGYKEINFARTALEIKSSVGAQPIEMFGFIEHSNSIINSKMGKLFNLLEPRTIWEQRHPFK